MFGVPSTPGEALEKATGVLDVYIGGGKWRR